MILPNNKWKNKSGKKVILLEPDEPWYINTGIKTPNDVNGLHDKIYDKLNEKQYKPYADFKSMFSMDVTRPDMGYGYSLASRLGQPCLCETKCKTEHFGATDTQCGSILNKTESIYLIYVLMFIISLMYFCVKSH